jgi:hypothetical protein
MSGQATRWFSEARTQLGSARRWAFELVELLGGHPQLQDRKLALGGSDRGPGCRRRLQPCRTCCPRLSVKSGAELALHRYRAHRRAQTAPHTPRDRHPAPASPEEAIGYLREHGITLTLDQAAGTLQAGTTEAVKTIIGKAS